MKKVVFICPWGNDKKNSWSGTHMGLYTNMSKNFDLVSINTGYNNDFINRILCYIDKLLCKIRGCGDMGMFRMKFMNYKLANKISPDTVRFQFEECPNIIGKCRKNEAYLYIDLHVGFLKKIFEKEKELYKISGFGKIKYGVLCRREKQQKKFMLKCKKIFTMGEWERIELVNNYGLPSEKVVHVGGGCNIDDSLIDYSDKRGNKILFVGKDFERKNGPLVVEAYMKAKKIIPDLELYIAGPSDIEYHENGIFCLGLLSFDELVPYYNKCDIFCLPSKFEAYGLVFAEALIFGLPCIGKNVFEMPYFIENGNTGALLENDDSDELCELIISVISSTEMKNNVIKRKNLYKSKYSWKNVVNRIQAEIEN